MCFHILSEPFEPFINSSLYPPTYTNIAYSKCITILKCFYIDFSHTAGCCMRSLTTVAVCTLSRGEATAPTWSGRQRTPTSSRFAEWRTTSKPISHAAVTGNTAGTRSSAEEKHTTLSSNLPLTLWGCKIIKDEENV